MNRLADSPIQEDRYIVHLAGQPNGKKTIKASDKNQAKLAQNHPLGNKIASLFTGMIKGALLSIVGGSVYPLLNKEMSDSIFGSTWTVCAACGSNIQSLVMRANNFKNFFDPNSKPVDSFAKYGDSYGLGLSVGKECATDIKALTTCRKINYGVSVFDTIFSINTIIGTACLIALFTYSKMNSYTTKKLQAKEKLINNLEERYGKIAARLNTLKVNKEVRDYANSIWFRQQEINQAIADLKLPNMKWKQIVEITNPVFIAADRIVQKYDFDLSQ